jgi:hypothetical protein
MLFLRAESLPATPDDKPGLSSFCFLPQYRLGTFEKAEEALIHGVIHDKEIIRNKECFYLQLLGFTNTAQNGGSIK